MYTVIKLFKDKYTGQIYKPGDSFKSDEKDRIKDLINRGLIKKNTEQSYDTLTKKEIIKLLRERNIEYNPKAKKEELIKLLEGD